MIFVTSGSMLAFDRLFRVIDSAVESGIIKDDVFGQIGDSQYEPQNYPFTRFLDKSKYDQYVSDARLVIAHAGIGIIMQSLSSGKPLLVMPRQAELGEHVNDHQVLTAERFEQLGHILSFNEGNLAQRIEQVELFVPKSRSPNVNGVGLCVAEFLQKLVYR
jgi:UDP-N-acetylglucosamine transferase subunit ALG13